MAALMRALLLALPLLLVCVPAAAESAQMPTAEQLAPLVGVVEGAGGSMDLMATLRVLVSGGPVSYEELLQSARAALMAELTRSLALLFQLLVPVALVAVLGELAAGSDRKAQAAGFICYLGASLALMGAFRSSAAAALALARDVGRFIEAMFPVLTALLAACGANLTAAAYAPLLSLGAGILSGAVSGAALALCSLAAVAAVFGSLSEQFSLGKLLELSKSLLNWMMGLALTGFLGLVAAQNLLSSAQDSAALRASKYAAKNLIPGVGGELADTMATLGTSAGAVKNALGVTGLLALVVICVGPLARLFAAMMTSKVACALFEPLGSGPLEKLIGRFADVFAMLMMAGCAAVAVGIILVGAALSAGNAALVP